MNLRAVLIISRRFTVRSCETLVVSSHYSCRTALSMPLLRLRRLLLNPWKRPKPPAWGPRLCGFFSYGYIQTHGSEYHQKHIVLIFWHKHVLSLVLLEVLDTFPSGRGAPEGAKMQLCQMLRFWNKETIWSHGLRTKRGIRTGYRPPPLLMHHLGTKHYGPGWAMSCWGIAVLMQYRMQSFINQSIYGKKRFNQSKTYRDRWVKRVS